MLTTFATIILVFIVSHCSSPNLANPLGQQTIRDKIIESLFNNYKNDTPPGELTQNQTKVIIYMDILAINSVDVRNMEYSVDIILRQTWTDQRLQWSETPEFKEYEEDIVSPSFKEKLWLPDLFFRNGKEGRLHSMTCENLLIRIDPNGKVLYSQKITMRMDCQMKLHKFPMDTQVCGMNIGSYGYTYDKLAFAWREFKAIDVKGKIQISEFDPPENFIQEDCTKGANFTTGTFTCLRANFTLKRQLGYWFASTYLPNILIMVVSWLNFWVSVDAIPARVNLSLLTLLGVITQASSYSSSLPRVSYIKAIDVWTIACLTFNSGVLVEFAIASHLARKHKALQWHRDVRLLVRNELVKWCSVCQQEYIHRGPSAAQAYNTANRDRRRGSDSTGQYINSTLTAAEHNRDCPIDDDNENDECLLFLGDSTDQKQPTSKGSRLRRLLGNAAGGGGSSPDTEGGPNSQVRRRQKRSGNGDDRDDPPVNSSQTSHGGGLDAYGVKDALLPSHQAKRQHRAKQAIQVSKIDLYSRILFPVGFGLFNLCYWYFYLSVMKS